MSKKADYYLNPIRKFFVRIFERICFKRKVLEKSAVFVSNPDFCDNSYPAFLEMQKLGYKCLWVLNYKYSKKVARGLNVKYIINKKNMRNMYILSSYKYFFYSHSLPYMYKKNDQYIYNCWHGSPFKKYHGVLLNNKENNHFFVPPSKESLTIYHEIYPEQIDISKSLPYRHFRTDFFLDYSYLDEKNKVVDFFKLKQYKKVALCCLTWIRDKEENGKRNNLLGYELTKGDYEKLNNSLNDSQTLLIIKPHPGQVIDDLNYSNIVAISAKTMAENNLQVYALIALSDILFTDYSSILFDFCLLDKPVGHIIHDWDYFTNNSNEQFIYDNPEDVMYGTKIHTLDELISFINNPNQNNEELRNKINSIYNDDYELKESSTLKFLREVLHEKV